MEKENKNLFLGDKEIRKVEHNGEWFFVVVDIIAAITDSPNPRYYWNFLKRHDPQLQTNCINIRVQTPEGMRFIMEGANTEGVFTIVMSIPSPKIEPIKMWLAHIGKTRSSRIENSYDELRFQFKNHIEKAQIRAMTSVNQQLLLLYWQIGNLILTLEPEEEWGSKIVTKLSKDLKIAFPNMSGLSERNLKYMRKFAKENVNFEFVQESLAQITWYHNQTLMDKIQDIEQRVWYARKAVENGWSRDMMVIHIEQNLHGRQGKSITNFSNTLPKPHSDLAQQTLKDPYLFDILNLTETASERDLENALIAHIEKFLLELGLGFAFIGRQYSIIIAEEEHRIDLLFYHVKLHCYIVIDLKIRKFEPEYAGRMNFYVNAVDDILKSPSDNPSIGIILCKDKDKVKAEYALKGISTPIGVSAFQLTDALSAEVKSNLPSIEDLEKKLKELK